MIREAQHGEVLPDDRSHCEQIMSNESEARRINSILKSKYGCNMAGQPIFRLSWSDAQREKRFGTFNEYYGDIFLRSWSGLREVPKYGYLKAKWVLERWLPPTLAYTEEIPETRNGSYEPIFVFQDEQYLEIPLQEQIIHRIIWQLFHPQLPGDRASDLREQDRLELAREIAHNVDELSEQGRTWIGHRLHSREAVIKP